MAAPKAAWMLGVAGLGPFVAGAAGVLFAPEAYLNDARAGLLLYGAVILSFLGGCRWGFAAAGLGEGPTFAPLAASTAPALVGWAALWAEPAIGPAVAGWILAAAFVAHYVWDAAATRTGAAPAWWAELRAPLTAGAALSLALAALWS